ncbi:MAG: hypothetical protein OXK76_12885 [Gammaproteobacteria bacterium]|nr:hypothetical protein [Gammaproteobacteria bacterium]
MRYELPPWVIETIRFDVAHDSLEDAGINTIPDLSTAVKTTDIAPAPTAIS